MTRATSAATGSAAPVIGASAGVFGLMLCYAAGDPIDMSAIQKTFATRLIPLVRPLTAPGGAFFVS